MTAVFINVLHMTFFQARLFSGNKKWPPPKYVERMAPLLVRLLIILGLNHKRSISSVTCNTE
jgi:hypothetical protein